MSDHLCDICGLEVFAIAGPLSGKGEPFIDGRCYTIVCHYCSGVPMTSEYDEETDEMIFYDEYNPDKINSPEALVGDGAPMERAQASYKAVKKLLKRAKFRVEPDSGVNVFDKLVFGDGLEFLLD